MFRWAQPVAFVNARVLTTGGTAPSIRFGARVLAIGEAPRRGERSSISTARSSCPGSINAHDHLELNHYGPLKRRDRYDNATEWIDDLRPALQARSGDPHRAEPPARGAAVHRRAEESAGRRDDGRASQPAVPRDRPQLPGPRPAPLRLGALLHARTAAGGRARRAGRRRSRAVSGDAARRARSWCTPAEGVDDAAAGEVARLERSAACGANTVIVHGIAMTSAEWHRVLARGASLVWCPASNVFLFGATAPVRAHARRERRSAWRRICLGSDSRISGSRDLLDELRVAAASGIAGG